MSHNDLAIDADFDRLEEEDIEDPEVVQDRLEDDKAEQAQVEHGSAEQPAEHDESPRAASTHEKEPAAEDEAEAEEGVQEEEAAQLKEQTPTAPACESEAQGTQAAASPTAEDAYETKAATPDACETPEASKAPALKAAKPTAVPTNKSKRPAFVKPSAAKPTGAASAKTAADEPACDASSRGTSAAKPATAKTAAVQPASKPLAMKKPAAKKASAPPKVAASDEGKENGAGGNTDAQAKKATASKCTDKTSAAKSKPLFKKPTAASGPPDPSTFKEKKAAKPAAKKTSEAAGKKSSAGTASKPRAQSAFYFFSQAHRKALADDEGLNFIEVTKRLSEVWRGFSDEDKQPFNEEAAADKERVEALIAEMPKPEPSKSSKKVSKKEKTAGQQKCAGKEENVEDAGDEAAGQREEEQKVAEKRKRKADTRSRNNRSRKRNKGSKDKDAEVPDVDEEDNESEYDWEKDHEDVNWSENAAQSILALTTNGKYVVKRQGLGIHEYGLVDASVAKRQCNAAGEASASSAILTEDIINEFESSKKTFEKDTMAHMTSRELDLDELDDGSLLEACSFLGDMRREGLLDRKGCKMWGFPDDRMNVPIMTTSFVVQRLVQCERQEQARLQKRVAELEQHLAAAAAKAGDLGCAAEGEPMEE